MAFSLSHDSVDSDWVRAEATDGLDREILISVAIEPNVKPPLRFRYIHAEQLIDWDGKRPSASFDKIVADLKAILKGQEPPKDTKLPELGISQSDVSRAIARAPEILQREEINGEWLEYQ